MEMMSVESIRARRDKLEQLARGLAKELGLLRSGGEWPLLYLERQAYRNGVADAVSGLEAARAALCNVLSRMDAERAA